MSNPIFSGTVGIWALKGGDFTWRNFAGTQEGADAAVTYAHSGGIVWIGKVKSGAAIVPSNMGTNPLVTVVLTQGNGFQILNQTLSTGRFGSFSSSAALRIVDGSTFSATLAGIQAAIDDLPTYGGTVLIPAGYYVGNSTIYTPCDRPVTLIGAGRSGGTGLATTLKNTADADVLVVRGNFQSVMNMNICGTGTVTATTEETRRGIVVGRKNVTDRHLGVGNEVTLAGSEVSQFVRLSNLHIYNTGGWALYYNGYGNVSDESTPEVDTTGTMCAIWQTVDDVIVDGGKAYGALFMGKGCTTGTFTRVNFSSHSGRTGNNQYYVYLNACGGIVFNNPCFEGYQPGANAWVRLYWCGNISFINPWFEHDGGETPSGAPTYFMETAGATYGTTVINPWFARGTSTSIGYLRAIKLNDDVQGFLLQNSYGAIRGEGYSGGTVDTEQYKFTGDSRGVTITGGFKTLNGADGNWYDPTISSPSLRLTMLGDKSLKIASWYKAEKNAATFQAQSLVYVSDASAGHELQYFDGTNWYYLTKTAITGGGVD